MNPYTSPLNNRKDILTMLGVKNTSFGSFSLFSGNSHPLRHRKRLLWDMLAFSLLILMLMFVLWGTDELVKPLNIGKMQDISLDSRNLPFYALRTTVRMMVAVGFSLLFSLLYATIAVKSRRAGQVMIPLLDVLQSVPVLGYISFTVTAFIALFPHSNLGVELAAIFAIFTSQAWNMTFSLYQGFSNVPADMNEAAFVFHLSRWQKFWRMELPFATPGLIWNTMMSMSGGWFFVVASEAITVGNEKITLPGIGSYISLAIEQQNIHAIFYAILAMTVVILLYDQLMFRPLVAWSDKFRYEMTANQLTPDSWVLRAFQKSRLMARIWALVEKFIEMILRFRIPGRRRSPFEAIYNLRPPERYIDYAWYSLLSAGGLFGIIYTFKFLAVDITLAEILQVFEMAFATLARVVAMILISSLIWVPVGIYVGLHPRLAEKIQPVAQFLAAFPANLIFPVAVMLIATHHLNPNIWLSPLILFGAQWYILFNVIAGAAAFPNDLKEAARNFRVKGFDWWLKVMLPGIFPHLLTGAITASGGAWNASIVAEMVSWGSTKLQAFGIGAYIARETEAGDFHRIVLGIIIMSLFVVMLNRLLWRRLYDMAVKKFRFD